MNPAAHGIDHIQFRHCLGQKRIPIAAGCFLSLNIIIRDSFEESAFILENQLIRILGYHNPSIAGVVLGSGGDCKKQNSAVGMFL